ncbi:MAG: penicillin acylase family protein, partial [Colwellia sp.]|nr:penicillin acylase family protein [Colwellia sp.]
MIKKIIIAILLVGSLVLSSGATWLYSKVDSALPLLEGKKTVFGLKDTALVERDDQGIVTIKAKSRVDIAVSTGFIHAQERFFQMDLLRRNSAGELSSLFGAVALDYDKSIRRHRFRERARKIVNTLPTEQKELLNAYTRGVNQGLLHLSTEPFEYLLLRQAPVQWSEEDSILAVFSMYIDLQYPDGQRERTLGLMKAVLSTDVYAFLDPKGSIWDAAIDGSQYKPAPMPTNAWPAASASVIKSEADLTSTEHILSHNNYQADEFPGSNNWAISGKVSSTGSAIV